VIKWPVKLRTFFQNPKKHDFLRFFEWLTTFSRTLLHWASLALRHRAMILRSSKQTKYTAKFQQVST